MVGYQVESDALQTLGCSLPGKSLSIGFSDKNTEVKLPFPPLGSSNLRIKNHVCCVSSWQVSPLPAIYRNLRATVPLRILGILFEVSEEIIYNKKYTIFF